MVNKKNDTNVLKFVGIAAGVTAGVAALAAGAFVAYRYFTAKKIEKACENCDLNSECHCQGKYARHCKGVCICEELERVGEEEFVNPD